MSRNLILDESDEEDAVGVRVGAPGDSGSIQLDADDILNEIEQALRGETGEEYEHDDTHHAAVIVGINERDHAPQHRQYSDAGERDRESDKEISTKQHEHTDS